MADVFTKKKRSEVMSNIRSKNTGIERKVFRFLRKGNVYFVRHYDRVPGKPDIALPREKKAVFLDGDFWHGYNLKKRSRTLPSQWKEKISNNVKRDKANRGLLKKMGWKVLSVWENDLKKNEAKTLIRILRFLNS